MPSSWPPPMPALPSSLYRCARTRLVRTIRASCPAVLDGPGPVSRTKIPVGQKLESLGKVGRTDGQLVRL